MLPQTVVSKYVQRPTDKKLLLRSFECTEIEEKEKCKSEIRKSAGICTLRFCAGPCVWEVDKTAETEKGVCGVSDTWAYSVVAEAGDESDPICRMASELAKTNCVDITDPQVCDAEPDCTSLLSGSNAGLLFVLLQRECSVDCWLSVDYQAKDVVKTDSDLKAAYDKLEEACSSYKTEDACHAKI